MSIRDLLKRAVAPELHSFPPAKRNAATLPMVVQPDAQQQCNQVQVSIEETVESHATGDATSVQQGSCTPLQQPCNNAEVAGCTVALHWGCNRATAGDAFTVRHARLLAMGLSDDQADALAERLMQRDLDYDDRALCAECVHFRRGAKTCGNSRQAEMPRELGELAEMFHRCPGFASDGRLE